MSQSSIVVDGIEDASLVAEITAVVRGFLEERPMPGAWRVTVKPSAIRGRWDVRLHGIGARHTLSLTVRASRLPAVLPHRLRESLDHLALLRLHVLRGARPFVRSVRCAV